MLFSASGAGLGGPAGLCGPGGIGGPAGVGSAASPAGVGGVSNASNPPAHVTTIPRGQSSLYLAIYDPEGIGVRGFIHNANNQPYGRRIAEALEQQRINDPSNSRHVARMDGNAERFFRGWADQNKPHLYANRVHGSQAMPNSLDIIRKLKRC